MRFSLLQLIVGITFTGIVLGLGVNNYKFAKALRAEQRYSSQLERYSRDLQHELSNAEEELGEIQISHAMQIKRWTVSGELKPQPPVWRCVVGPGLFVMH